MRGKPPHCLKHAVEHTRLATHVRLSTKSTILVDDCPKNTVYGLLTSMRAHFGRIRIIENHRSHSIALIEDAPRCSGRQLGRGHRLHVYPRAEEH